MFQASNIQDISNEGRGSDLNITNSTYVTLVVVAKGYYPTFFFFMSDKLFFVTYHVFWAVTIKIPPWYAQNLHIIYYQKSRFWIKFIENLLIDLIF